LASDEILDVVSEHDEVTGRATIKDCLENGLLHRAIAVLVVRSDGHFLLQQRSKRDRWQPGLWTLSSTGHVAAGESYDRAAARELAEELGLIADPFPLKKYLLPPIRSGGLTEREWVTLYVARTDLPSRIDKTEVEQVQDVDEPGLRHMFHDGSMTPDAVILMTDYLDHLSRI
jgi:isopentenyl-diphosphate Delta-isomerase